MKSVEIKCDGCGADLKYTGNCVDYRLVLANENIPSRGGLVTAMGVYPDLDRDYHFCGLGCLDQWRDHERLYAKLRKELSDKWADEKGTNLVFGRSYPVPPDDVLKAWEEECRSAASAEFPLERP